MSKTFINAPGDVVRPGVYAIKVAPPRVLRGASLGYVALAGVFAWGPDVATYLPDSADDLLATYEPKGSPRTSTGYYALMQRLGATWFISRVLGTGASAATVTKAGTGGAWVATAKYKGALGNSIQVTQGPATDGNAAHKDITVTLTDPTTKTTKEVFRNVVMAVNVVVTGSRLLASFVFTGTMTVWPADATTNLATGSDGAAPGTSDYSGAIDLFGFEDNARIVVIDDCGDTNRAAINSYLQTHVTTFNNRVTFLQGAQGNAWSAVKTDKANYTSERCSYVANWVQVYDDGGVLRTTPAATMIATIRNQVGVTTSVAARDDATLKYFQNVRGLVGGFASTDSIQDEATGIGVMIMIRLPSGKYALNHGRTVNNATGSTISWECEVWYNDYLAMTLIPGLGFAVNGGNDVDENNTIKGMVIRFMKEEERLKHVIKKPDPNNPSVKLPAFSVDIDSVNNATTLSNGDFFIQIDGGFPGVRERIYLLQNVGTNVAVRTPTT